MFGVFALLSGYSPAALNPGDIPEVLSLKSHSDFSFWLMGLDISHFQLTGFTVSQSNAFESYTDSAKGSENPQYPKTSTS